MKKIPSIKMVLHLEQVRRLEVPNDLPKHAPGLFHAGSVGIIMSGWLGTINYGVITANKLTVFYGAKKSI